MDPTPRKHPVVSTQIHGCKSADALPGTPGNRSNGNIGASEIPRERGSLASRTSASGKQGRHRVLERSAAPAWLGGCLARYVYNSTAKYVILLDCEYSYGWVQLRTGGLSASIASQGMRRLWLLGRRPGSGKGILWRSEWLPGSEFPRWRLQLRPRFGSRRAKRQLSISERHSSSLFRI